MVDLLTSRVTSVVGQGYAESARGEASGDTGGSEDGTHNHYHGGCRAQGYRGRGEVAHGDCQAVGLQIGLVRHNQAARRRRA